MIELPDQLSSYEKEKLNEFFQLLRTNELSLENIWYCMDSVWDALECDNKNIDLSKIQKFYSHPVWLLNGLFIEQHTDSLRFREIFSDWVASIKPDRVADYGGGFGTLARMIASKCPDAQVEVVEPYPHDYALELSKNYPNLMFSAQLEGEYDLILATDVFEHVTDPLAEVEKTSRHLSIGGKYLIANCFYPVIKCHLPCTFHFRYSWQYLLKKMNLEKGEQVAYGNVFEKKGIVSSSKVRFQEQLSRISFPIIKLLLPLGTKIYWLLIRLKNKLRNIFGFMKTKR